MKLIKYWHVKLYRNLSTIPLSRPMETLIFEGYSKDKPVLKPHDEGLIELFTEPDQLETKTIRTCGFSSMVCTPVYEGVEAALNPPRAEMLEYVKAAIGEGYQPECEAAISDLAWFDAMDDNTLNREYGKCWQWYAMGGGMHETFEQKVCFEEVKQATLNALKNVDPQKEKAAADTDEAKSRYEYNSFKSASKPLVKWLNENANPHATVIVEVDGATLYSAESHAPVREFLKD